MDDVDERFCDECEVSKDLHCDPDFPTPADCVVAGRKADLLARIPF
jgi:hypothetical protein